MDQITTRKKRDVLDVAAALKALDQLAAKVASSKTFEALDAVAREAASIQYRFRPVFQVAARAGEVWVDAEQKLGDELAKMPSAKGTRGQFAGAKLGKRGRRGVITGGAIIEPPVKDVPSLHELGVAKKRATRAKRLARITKPERRTFTEELVAVEKAITPYSLLQKLRERNKRDKKHKVVTAAFSADGPFDVVVIDPPWPMAKIDREVTPDQDAFDYPVMMPEEIEQFWRDKMVDRVTPDCHLFMWTTQKWLPVALNLIGRIGFRYVLTMVWHKPGGFQPFELPQYNCEFIVYGRIGAPMFVDTKDFNCCFDAPRREHSRKPDEFYDTIRRVTGGSRVDVFSREPREGFAQYGNQPAAFGEMA